MNQYILNIMTQLLAYNDPTVTDNPHQRAFDHTRRIQTISLNNPYGNALTLAPGQSFTIFDGTKSSALNGSSILSLELLSAQNSVYRIQVTAGPSGFKTARSPSGITACNVTINNNAAAVFDFTGSTLNDVAVGDLMRIAGAVLYDTGSFAFNPLNAGLWKIIGVSGTQVTVVREVGEVFQAAAESVGSVSGSDVEFYADDGVQPGDNLDITGTFSSVSQRTYQILDATPTTLDFVSAIPLPLESGLTYIASSLTIYNSIKKLVYIEVDQDAVVQFNGDTTNNNRLTPISAGDQTLPGYLHKWGSSYSCTVVNRSVNPCKVKFIMGE